MNKLTLKENGKTKEYNILYSFETDKKEYIIYTDGIIDDDGFTKTYVGIHQNENGKDKILPVKDDNELEMINKVLNKLTKEE